MFERGTRHREYQREGREMENMREGVIERMREIEVLKRM